MQFPFLIWDEKFLFIWTNQNKRIELWTYIFTCYVYIRLYNKSPCTRRYVISNAETRHAWICVCMRAWVEVRHNGFSNFMLSSRSRIDAFRPSASSFAPARSKPRSASLTLEVCAACLCTAVIYSLFERYGSGFSLALLGRRRKWIRTAASAKFVDFKLSERSEFVDIPPRHPMYREPSWKLLVMQLAAGAGNPGQTDSSHTELISRALRSGYLETGGEITTIPFSNLIEEARPYLLDKFKLKIQSFCRYTYKTCNILHLFFLLPWENILKKYLKIITFLKKLSILNEFRFWCSFFNIYDFFKNFLKLKKNFFISTLCINPQHAYFFCHQILADIGIFYPRIFNRVYLCF